MSEQIKHECGIALLRLRKPLEHYLNQYGSAMYGIEKMSLLMEKQHNRGQDGAGIVCLKLDTEPGVKYLHAQKSAGNSAIMDIFNHINQDSKSLENYNSRQSIDIPYLKENLRFVGEVFLGHLRYGTFGKNSLENVHPVMRINNWKSRSLAIAGNFNLTNVNEMFHKLISYGEHPTETSDTITILEKIGFFLDKAHEALWQDFVDSGMSKKEATLKASEHMDITNVLRNSAKHVDGGYVISGVIGHGDAFIMRDPAGIRPAYYYYDDEIFVAASERPPIQTAFNIPLEKIKEIEPAKAIIITKNGDIHYDYFIEPLEKKPCSFERIYFSRGTDAGIYNERKHLGKTLAHRILKQIDYDLENTVFSFIPNTAIAAFLGLREEIFNYLNQLKKQCALDFAQGKIGIDEFNACFEIQPRIETVAVKDIKLRTFITQDSERDDLVAHVYDVTYGVIRNNLDTLLVIDDSIVRGTTLKQSIIKMLDRLLPKKIIIASSAPQIRYPDCYGIDMAKLSDFIAFKAAITLLKETKQEHIINDVYRQCKQQENKPIGEVTNVVKQIYKPFTADEISKKITQLLTPANTKAQIEIIYQSIEDLHEACPNNKGDWYFTGNYPTPGGNRVVNQSFINFVEGKNERGYGI
jgi:amidophosphoribosyltransferase